MNPTGQTVTKVTKLIFPSTDTLNVLLFLDVSACARKSNENVKSVFYLFFDETFQGKLCAGANTAEAYSMQVTAWELCCVVMDACLESYH